MPTIVNDRELISPNFCARLSKVLGLLGSSHDGEALAAGRRANAMVRSASCTWSDLVQPPRLPPPDPEDVSELQMAEACLECSQDIFDEREIKFLAAIGVQLRRGGKPLSPKQTSWLAALYDRAQPFTRRSAT
jgi:hypothetical protein